MREQDSAGERERLRRALYRAGAGEDDRSRFAAAQRTSRAEAATTADRATAESATAEPAANRSRPQPAAVRRLGLIAALVITAWAVLTPVVAGLHPRPVVHPVVRQLAVRAVVFGGGTKDPARERADLAALLAASGPSLQEHLRTHAADLPPAVLDTHRFVGVTGVGTTRLRLAALGRIDRGSRVTVLLACTGSARYSWLLTASAADGALRAGASARCSGGVVHSELVPPAAVAPQSLTVTMPADPRIAIEVTVVSAPIGAVFGSASALH